MQTNNPALPSFVPPRMHRTVAFHGDGAHLRFLRTGEGLACVHEVTGTEPRPAILFRAQHGGLLMARHFPGSKAMGGKLAVKGARRGDSHAGRPC